MGVVPVGVVRSKSLHLFRHFVEKQAQEVHLLLALLQLQPARALSPSDVQVEKREQSQQGTMVVFLRFESESVDDADDPSLAHTQTVPMQQATPRRP